MMDIRTGEVLCMVSAPSFDANKFVTGVPSADYRLLADYDHKPLLIDKALSGTYPPGSTFKTMVALTAMEKGHSIATAHATAAAAPGSSATTCSTATRRAATAR